MKSPARNAPATRSPAFSRVMNASWGLESTVASSSAE